jgi:hypothetical protein
LVDHFSKVVHIFSSGYRAEHAVASGRILEPKDESPGVFSMATQLFASAGAELLDCQRRFALAAECLSSKRTIYGRLTLRFKQTGARVFLASLDEAKFGLNFSTDRTVFFDPASGPGIENLGAILTKLCPVSFHSISEEARVWSSILSVQKKTAEKINN